MATPATYELLERRNAAGDTVSVAAMVESIVGCKWSMSLLGLIARDVVRPSCFLRECPGLSAKVMNERLRKMVRFGLITRTVRGEKPPLEVRYALTPFGSQFVRVLEEIQRLQAQLDEHESRANAGTGGTGGSRARSCGDSTFASRTRRAK